jgi:hypothetical protein
MKRDSSGTGFWRFTVVDREREIGGFYEELLTV